MSMRTVNPDALLFLFDECPEPALTCRVIVAALAVLSDTEHPLGAGSPGEPAQRTHRCSSCFPDRSDGK